MPNEHVAVVGASSAIAQATQRRLIERGAACYLGTRDPEGDLPDAAYVKQVDATSWDDVEKFIREVQEDSGGLTGLALFAGSILLKPAHQVSEDEWKEVLSLNLHSAFGVVRAAGKLLKKSKTSVVLFSTVAAHTGLPNHEAIAAAKAGVEGLMRAAAATYAPFGLRFNCVAPGLTETPMAASLTGNEAMRKASEKMHPLGRIGTPDDVAAAAAWLLDPAQEWITGQVIGVDGGLSTLRPRAGS